MSLMSEDDLAKVSAQSGISHVIGNSQLRITYDSIRISDTDSVPRNYIEFNNLTIDDGEGGYFSLDTPPVEQDFNTFDIATLGDGQSLVLMNLSHHVEPRTYTVGNLVFCDQDLGSVRLDNLTQGASDKLIIGSHSGGGTGIDMEYQTKIDIDSLEYTYNNQSASLLFSGIHLSQHALGSPEDPSSWDCLGKFQLGDIEDDNPMTIDVVTSDDNVTSMFINMPMMGNARVEAVDFDGNHFGPCAIDGMTVHYLGIQIPGN